jgi:hypothetical protein
MGLKWRNSSSKTLKQYILSKPLPKKRSNLALSPIKNAKTVKKNYPPSVIPAPLLSFLYNKFMKRAHIAPFLHHSRAGVNP